MSTPYLPINFASKLNLINDQWQARVVADARRAGLGGVSARQGGRAAPPAPPQGAAPAPLGTDARFTVAVATAVVEAAPGYMTAEGPFGTSMQYINGGVRTLTNNGAHA